MADEHTSDSAAEAALDEHYDPSDFTAEAVDDGTNAEPRPAGELPPGFDLSSLTHEQLFALGEGSLVLPDKNTEQEGDEGLQNGNEPGGEKSAKADLSKVPRIRINHYNPEDRARMVQINDLTRGGMSLDDALAFVAKAKPPVVAATQEPENAAASAPTDAMTVARAKAEAARDAFIDAQQAFDKDGMRAAQIALEQANADVTELRILEELERRESSREQTRVFAGEMDGLRAVLPELTQADSPLADEYNALVDSLPESMIGPGKMEKVARMAWASVHPDKPFPKKAAQSAPVISPRKQGTPVAALSANGGQRTRDVHSIAQRPGGIQSLSDEELRAYAGSVG